MKPKELRSKSALELKKMEAGLIDELLQLKMKLATSQLEKNHRVRQVKKGIARVKTIIHEQSQQANNSSR